jgi:hypothetical protein
MPDTLATNVAELTQEMIDATLMLLPQQAPMLPLVTRRDIMKGHDRLEIPRVNSTSTVQTPTEGDELVSTSQFDLTSTTIQPTLRALYVRLTERAEYFSRDDLVALVSEELAQTQAQDIDTDLTAEFANFGAGNDVGSTNTDLSLAVLADAHLLLISNTRANGGPAAQPIYCVLAPVPEHDVFTNLGMQGVVSSTSPWIPAGISEEIIRNYHIPQNRLVGVSFFRDGYMTENGSADFICGMFGAKALWLAVSKNWDLRPFEDSSWIGTIIRCRADYNSGVGGYPLHGSQITADGV